MNAIQSYLKTNTSFYNSAIQIFLLASAIKILLIPSYHSTDFEVHRNWLAITHSLPHDQWYFEDTSIWTLDYPPFFAWFEYFLSQFSGYFDEKMLDIHNLNYASENTVLFQRFSVIICDIVLFIGIYAFCSTWLTTITSETNASLYKKEIIFAFCILSPALFMIDHIHFQYNGFLLGIYMLSIAFIRMNQDLLAAITFSILLNFKQIFMYQAPVYFVYLLLHYCYIPDTLNDMDVEFINSTYMENRRPSEAELSMYTYPSKSKFSLKRFLALALIVILTFFISFLPFICPSTQPITTETIIINCKQLFSRLFPFKRGLIHTYWAPNFWALYAFLDKILSSIAHLSCRYSKTFCSVQHHLGGASGITGDIIFNVLPNIPSFVTFILTLLFMIPCLIPLFMHPHPRLFVNCIITCSFISFLFGWHVHEKALLTILLPITVLSCETALDARIFILFSTITHISFFPLLYKPQEFIIKILFTIIYFYSICLTLDDYHKKNQRLKKMKQEGVHMTYLDRILLFTLLFVTIYSIIIHPLVFKNKYEFLPLMLISVTCSCGIIYCFFLSLISTYKKNDILQTYLATPSSSDTSEMESEGDY